MCWPHGKPTGKEDVYFTYFNKPNAGTLQIFSDPSPPRTDMFCENLQDLELNTAMFPVGLPLIHRFQGRITTAFLHSKVSNLNDFKVSLHGLGTFHIHSIFPVGDGLFLGVPHYYPVSPISHNYPAIVSHIVSYWIGFVIFVHGQPQNGDSDPNFP